ncbi:hypothetical protein K435DRAFT_881485 [Dendrothele bispora CBS 962.96]|uniref:Uncharacterized protein n=1 Tax=Dendrothele bispora (strain CBS 962.96) TaxID=1314807 RepID=A0A4S8KIB5_DENBC|nr:hypothetical protein K435DRAFT_881485 [Dendrothele bispora CBS 962.96]
MSVLPRVQRPLSTWTVIHREDDFGGDVYSTRKGGRHLLFIGRSLVDCTPSERPNDSEDTNHYLQIRPRSGCMQREESTKLRERNSYTNQVSSHILCPLSNPNGTSTPRILYPSYKINGKSTSRSSSSNSSGLKPGGPSGPRRPLTSSPSLPSFEFVSQFHCTKTTRTCSSRIPPLAPATPGSLGVKQPHPAHYRHGSGGGATERRPSPLNYEAL